MSPRGRRQLLPALLLALAVFAGCGADDEEGAAAFAGQLGELPWVVVSGIDAPGWEERPPTLMFSEGRAAVSDGCNRLMADYTLDGEALRLKVQSSTARACHPPEGDVAAEFMSKLERVAAWRLQDDELVLADDSGGELLRFTVPSLEGDWTAHSTYQVTSVSSLVEGTEITASFVDGTLTGSAGCNTYRATYQAGRGTLKISPPAGTRMMCAEPAGVMEQEQTYLAALPEVGRYSIVGDELSLLRADGTIVALYGRRP